MLVHICCSVDSHYFLSELQKIYPSENLIGFFYNPNIHPKAEHDLRLQDVRRSCEMLGVNLIEGRYDVDNWLEGVRGLEDAPEKGERCVSCFDIRLEKSAELATQIGETKFTSTLLASPMKEQEILYVQGDIIAKKHSLDFVKINIRSNGGVNKQNALAKKDNLYRQNYCGCKYALEKQREKQGRYSLEMMSDIGKRALPASIEERSEIFAKRDALEKHSKRYILAQRKKRIYRMLTHKLSLNGVAISNYVLAHSESRHTKIENLTWVKIFIDSTRGVGGVDIDFDLSANIDSMTRFYDKYLQESKKAHSNKHIAQKDTSKISLAQKHTAITIGISNKDDSMFLPLRSFNAIASTTYNTVSELIYNPIAYEKELELRTRLCGYESLNPIVVVDDWALSKLDFLGGDTKHSDMSMQDNLAKQALPNSTNTQTKSQLMLHIESFFQDEKVFEVVEIL